MRVRELAQHDVVACSTRDGLDRAVQLMWEHDVGCLPVVDGGYVVGMVTDRDVCMATFLRGRPLQSMAVSSVMTREVVTCTDDDKLEDILQVMKQRQLRRVPVVDLEGHLRGLITVNDLARAAERKQIASSEVTSALAAITHPRVDRPDENALDVA